MELLISFLKVDLNSRYPSDEWRKLFEYYNMNKKPEDKRMGMGCPPCYGKVYNFCRIALLEQFKKPTNA